MQYLQNQLSEIENGRVIFYSIEEANKIPEPTIRQSEC